MEFYSYMRMCGFGLRGENDVILNIMKKYDGCDLLEDFNDATEVCKYRKDDILYDTDELQLWKSGEKLILVVADHIEEYDVYVSLSAVFVIPENYFIDYIEILTDDEMKQKKV